MLFALVVMAGVLLLAVVVNGRRRPWRHGVGGSGLICPLMAPAGSSFTSWSNAVPAGKCTLNESALAVRGRYDARLYHSRVITTL